MSGRHIRIKRDKESLIALCCHSVNEKYIRRLSIISLISVLDGLLLLGILPLCFSPEFFELIIEICFVTGLILLVAVPCLCYLRVHKLRYANLLATDESKDLIYAQEKNISDVYLEIADDQISFSTENEIFPFPPLKIKRKIIETVNSVRYLFIHFDGRILIIPENGLPEGTLLEDINRLLKRNK